MSTFSFPQELWDHVLDFVGGSTDWERTLRACALVHTAWTQRSQEHLFEVIIVRSDAEWCRLHTLLHDTAPHLRRCVRKVELRRTANTDTGALDWTDLLPLVTHLRLLRSPPDLGFMAQLPRLRHLRVGFAGHHSAGPRGWDAYIRESMRQMPLKGARDPRLPQELVCVIFEGDTVQEVQLLILYWMSSTATVCAQTLRRLDLAILPDTQLKLMQEFLDINNGITDLGLFITREPVFTRINACVLRLEMHVHLPVWMALDLLHTAALPALRILELTFIGFERTPHRDEEDRLRYFDPFEGAAVGDTSDDEEYTISAPLAAQVYEVKVTLENVKVLYHARRFLQLFREVDELNKLRLYHDTDLRKEDCAKL